MVLLLVNPSGLFNLSKQVPISLYVLSQELPFVLFHLDQLRVYKTILNLIEELVIGLDSLVRSRDRGLEFGRLLGEQVPLI